MSKKALQLFTKEYLQNCKKLNHDQIAQFLEDYRQLHSAKKKKVKSILISIKIPEDLLEIFKKKSENEKIPYQTQIKKLMKDWI